MKIINNIEFARRLTGTVNTTDVSPQDRSLVVNLGIAKTIGYQLPIPATPVISPVTYFSETFKTEVNEIVSTINEVYVLDVTELLKYVKAIWVMRYRLVHEPRMVKLNKLIQCIDINTVDPTSLELINKLGDSCSAIERVSTLTLEFTKEE